jgi:parallel beta-helix repeat protein
MTGYNTTQNQKIVSRAIISALVLWLAFSGMAAAEQLYVNESGWWRDGGMFNASGTPIQAAVGAADEGDAIYVHGGNYYENVDVDTPRITLEGGGADVVTVTAASPDDHVFEVTADYVNISGFAVRGATSFYMSGIYLYDADHCNISENKALGSYHGIYLDYSSNNTLQDNTMSDNMCNFGVNGDSFFHHLQNIGTSNKVDGKPIYYWVDKKNKQVPADAGFVGVMNSTNITVRDAILTKNLHGVLFVYTDDSTIENVTTSVNVHGICLRYSNNNTLQNNTANSNTHSGIYLISSSNNTLSNNTANSNTHGSGIWLVGSNNNTLQNNTANSNDYYNLCIDSVSNNKFTNTAVNPPTPATYSIDNHGIWLEYSSDNTLISNTAKSNDDHSIWLVGSNNNTLVSNTVSSNNDDGIRLSTSSNNTLKDNTCSNNDDGIHLRRSSNNTLINNTANSNRHCGIDLFLASNNTLTNNTIFENTCNFRVWGDSLSYYNQSIDPSNTVDGRPIYYWVDLRDKEIPDNAGYVGVVNSTNITVRNLTLTKNHEGVLFAYTKNSKMENITASNNSEYGIHLRYSNNNTISNSNTSSNGCYGICLRYSSDNTLSNNTANSNNWHGILLRDSSNNNTLTNNAVSLNIEYGIWLLGSSNNTLTNNTISENMYNFGVNGHGYTLSDYTQDVDTSNTVDGKPIYYWVDKEDKQIPDDAGFVGVVNSTNITVRDMSLTKNEVGVLFAYVGNSRIENVTASANRYGIHLYHSSNGTLSNSTADSNSWPGISLMYASNNSLTNNTCSNSSCGIGLCYSSNNNTLTKNTASNNGRGISISSSSGNTLSGNIVNSNRYGGIRLWDSGNNNVTCNWVQNNTWNGFCLSGYDGSPNNNISYNNIIENGDYNTSTGSWEWQFYNDQPYIVEAQHNYWGVGMNNRTIDASIYDDDESSYLGKVEFYPFETEPVPCAPTPEESHTFTTADAVIALQIAAGSRPPDLQWDVSGDKRVTSLDALMILQAAAGGIEIG